MIIPNPHLQSPQYQLKEAKEEHAKAIPSYKLAKIPRVEATSKKSFVTKQSPEPVINQYLTTDTTAAPGKTSSSGLIKRLWDIMLGADTSTTSKQTATQSTPKSRSQHNTRKPTQRRSSQSKPPREKRSAEKSSSRRPSTSKDDAKSRTRRGGRAGTRRPSGKPSETSSQHHRRPADQRKEEPVVKHEIEPAPLPPHDVEYEVMEPKGKSRRPVKPETNAPKKSQEPIKQETKLEPAKPETKPETPVHQVTQKPQPPASPAREYKGFGHDDKHKLEQVTTKTGKEENETS